MSKPKTIKISIVGDRSVGRSKLLMAWEKGSPIDDTTKIWETVRPFKKPVTQEGTTYSISLCDTPSEDRVRLRAMSYTNSRCIILCFALDNAESFKYITVTPPDDAKISSRSLVEEVKDVLDNKPMILVGSKSDSNRVVSKEEAEKLAKDIGAKQYMEFNHKDWSSINAILELAIKLGVENLINNPKADSDSDSSSEEKDNDKIESPKNDGTAETDNTTKKCCIVI